jgi:putative peptidoglycan lipid II flippase
MVCTLISRLLGLVRDITIASNFGTSQELDAYQAAFRIPDLLFLIVIGGALGSSLIPVFSKFLGQNDDAKAWRLANTIINYAFIVLAVVAAVCWLLAPFIVQNILVAGASDYTKSLTLDLTRLLLLQPFFLGLGGIAWALLNGLEKFFFPAIVPIIYNICILGGALLAPQLGIYGPAYGVIVGSIFYMLVQLPALYRQGFYFKPTLEVAPGAKEVFAALGPRILGQSALYANMFMITVFAGFIGGSEGGRISAFTIAYQVFMLPHGLFAWSIATASFPALSKMAGTKDFEGFKYTLNNSLRQVLFITFPATVGLMTLAYPLVTVLFKRGRFDDRSVQLVADALVLMSVGLVAYGVVEILTRAYFALQDSWTPVIVALPTFLLNISLCLILAIPFQHAGLSFALALSTIFEMTLLALLLRRKIGNLGTGAPGSFITPTAKIVLATAAMGVVLVIALALLNNLRFYDNPFTTILVTALLIGLGAATYLGAALVLKLDELKFVVRLILRR